MFRNKIKRIDLWGWQGAKLHLFLTHAKEATRCATFCILYIRDIGRAVLMLFSSGGCHGQPKSHPDRRSCPYSGRPLMCEDSLHHLLPKTGSPSCGRDGARSSGRARPWKFAASGSSPRHRWWGKGSPWNWKSYLCVSSTAFPFEMCKHPSAPLGSRLRLPYLATRTLNTWQICSNQKRCGWNIQCWVIQKCYPGVYTT